MRTFFSILITCLISFQLVAQKVEWYSTTEQASWVKEKSIKLNPISKAKTSSDIVVSDNKAQAFDGFGGTFNENGWDALNALSEKDRSQILDDLFSASGANFYHNRMPMGASDFGLSFYSFNDVVDDFNMINFNIDRDRYILMPYIREAQKRNRNFTIWASPWSPPGWMKTNCHYASNMDIGGVDVNGLPEEKILELPTTGFKMQRGYLQAYALYFSKFVQAYEKEGIPIEAVHVQNEPCSNHKFPSCNWRSEDLAYFIGKFLGPKFEEDGITSDIYFGTINRDNPEYTRIALRDTDAAKYIKGVGFQWDGKWAIPHIHKEYPHLRLMQTEMECGNGDNNWGAAEYTWGIINHYIKNGANTFAYWNMILNHTLTSPWGWKQNTLIAINKDTKEVTYHPEYYIMKHASHYIEPGAYRLHSSDDDNHIAFLNADGSVVLVLVNRTDDEKNIQVELKERYATVKLKPRSFNTLRFRF